MLISIFEYDDYRVFLNTWIDSQSTRGLKGQIAKALNVSSTLISLILKGDKQLSAEQALELCEYLGFNEKEADYFMLLVEIERAGTFKLKEKLKNKLLRSKNEAKQISQRVKKDKELSEDQKAIYYSSWIYTGIRNLSATEQFNDVTPIAKRLNLPANTVKKCLDFLIQSDLCVLKSNQLSVGPSYTHINNDSPLVNKHHQNWRVKGIQQMDAKNESDLFYTCPMSLSGEASAKVRELLLKTIQEALKIVGPSPSEEVKCLNIDWFEY